PYLLLFVAHSQAWEYGSFEKARERLKKMYEVTTTHELVDAIVDDMCETFPELCLDTEEEMRGLKREMVEHSKNTDPSLRADVLAGFPTKYKYLPLALKKAKTLGRKIFSTLTDLQRERFEDVDDFLFKQMLYWPMRRHAQLKKKYYADHGLSEDEGCVGSSNGDHRLPASR
ncbi:hypothetical protein PMAYCL1PPCAC_06073, partial [Pristionchus mayeri]